MKKYILIMLAVLMLVSVSVSMAETMEEEIEIPDTLRVEIEMEEMGFYAALPKIYRGENGFALPVQKGILKRDPYVANLALMYFPLSYEYYQSLENSYYDLSEDEIETVKSLFSIPARVIVTNGTLDDIMPFIESEIKDEPIKIASNKGYDYWFISTVSDAYYQIYNGDALESEAISYEEELDKIRNQFFTDMEDSAYFEPIDEAARYVGKTISFTTYDLDGNAVTSEELFADNKVTMINVWGTWCGDCVGELEELGNIHRRLQDKNCGIVGVEYEFDWGEEMIDQSKSIFEYYNVDYPNVVVPDEPIFNRLESFPTTFFVDKEGKILTYPIDTAAVSKYEDVIDDLLSGKEVKPVAGKDAVSNQIAAYRVFVYDKNGPVKGVVIQFCDDKSCTIGKTDEDGVARFEKPAGTVYEVHVLKVPDGYEKKADTFYTLDRYSDIDIVLLKK